MHFRVRYHLGITCPWVLEPCPRHIFTEIEFIELADINQDKHKISDQFEIRPYYIPFALELLTIDRLG